MMTDRKASLGSLDTKLKKRKKIFQKKKLKKTDLKRNSCDKWNSYSVPNKILVCQHVPKKSAI